MKKILPIIMALSSSLYASPLSENLMNELCTNKVVERTVTKKESTSLLLVPDTPIAKDVSSKWNAKGNPVFLVEKLYLIDTDLSIQELSKISRSISTMEGIQYYSNGDKKWETLYHKSSFVEDLKKNKPVPDPLEGSAEGVTGYVYQKDNSLGSISYLLNYREGANEVGCTFNLEEAIKIGPVVAVHKNNLVIGLDIIKTPEGTILYMMVESRYPSMSALESRMNKSFNARLDAIYSWFMDQIKEYNK